MPNIENISALFTRFVIVYSVEHVPRSYYAQDSPAESSHTTSTDADAASAASHHGGSSDQAYDSMGQITHDVMTHKKQEVYEEKGYMDSAYDHSISGNPSADSDGAADGESSGSKDHPLHQSLHADGSSTKLLEYAARALYDREAHEKGIYGARDGVRCPEVTDFKLKGTVRGRQPDGRVTGLGAHIDCQRLKYFGSEPLPRAIFQDPAKSRKSVIQMQSFEQFMSDAKRNLF